MKSHIVSATVAAVIGFGFAAAVQAQQPPPEVEQGAAFLALKTLPAKSAAPLRVTTPAFQPGGDIPFANTQYQTNTFPGLSWTAGPAATRSYVLIMQDTDAMVRGAPILHWTMYNIAGTSLPAGLTAPPAGAAYGPNIRGANQAYMGPRTPAGPKHRYHFQIFALDTAITADPALTYESLTAAMKDHVLASGEIIGLGQVDPSAPPPAGRGGPGRGAGAPAAPAAAAPAPK